jgi:hypothetical protein
MPEQQEEQEQVTERWPDVAKRVAIILAQQSPWISTESPCCSIAKVPGLRRCWDLDIIGDQKCTSLESSFPRVDGVRASQFMCRTKTICLLPR